MPSLEKYSLSPASSRTWISLNPGGNQTGFPHAEGHTEYQAESHITAVSNYPKVTPHLSIPCHFDSVSPLTQPLCWSIPCRNCWSALVGCWSIAAQPKAHHNQPVDSQGLSKMCRHHLATHSLKRLPWKSVEPGISCWESGEVVLWCQ